MMSNNKGTFIEINLNSLESNFNYIKSIIAKKTKFAVAIAQPLPITLELLNNWVKGLKAKGIALAPVSTIADKQSQR